MNNHQTTKVTTTLSPRRGGGGEAAFLTVPRKEAGYRPVHDRIHDFGEVEQTLNTRDRQEQASRCMDCGVPFCHWACPLGNKDPEWNDALYRGEWEMAYQLLTKTNPFPEFTGRICPALCEKACVLYHTTGEAVTNRENEAAIAEHAFLEGYVQPCPPAHRIRRRSVVGGSPADIPVRVAVIGSGPAGLAAANALNQMGYTVPVFEKNEAAGGLLRYGIPNFKLNKEIIDRRIKVMEQEGIEFRYGSALPTSPKGEEKYSIDTLYAAFEELLPLGGGWEGAFQCLPCQPLLLILLRHEDAEEEGDEDADEHGDEAEEEEVGLGEEVHVEDGGGATEEAYDGGTGTDAGEEDAHHEQTADGAAEEAEDGVEIVEERLYVHGGHEPGDGHAEEAGTDACDAGDIDSSP